MTSYDDRGPRAVTEAVVVCGRRPPNVVYLLFQQGLPCVLQLCCWGPEKHLVGNGYSLRGCVGGMVDDKFCGWKMNKIIYISYIQALQCHLNLKYKFLLFIHKYHYK